MQRGTAMGTRFHGRMNNDRADIIHKRIEEKAVAAHFNTQGHSAEDLAVMVIERYRKDDPALQKIRENKWIRTLDTPCPRGTNLRTDSFQLLVLTPLLNSELHPNRYRACMSVALL